MTADLDLTQPGPAGMWSDNTILSPEGMRRDQAARNALETFCDSCGLIGASFGYGMLPGRRGFTACSNPDCRAVCARAASDPKAAQILLARKQGGQRERSQP